MQWGVFTFLLNWNILRKLPSYSLEPFSTLTFLSEHHKNISTTIIVSLSCRLGIVWEFCDVECSYKYIYFLSLLKEGWWIIIINTFILCHIWRKAGGLSYRLVARNETASLAASCLHSPWEILFILNKKYHCFEIFTESSAKIFHCS